MSAYSPGPDYADLECSTCPRCGAYLHGSDRLLSVILTQAEGCRICEGAVPAKTPMWEPLVEHHEPTQEERERAAAWVDYVAEQPLLRDEEIERKPEVVSDAAWLAGKDDAA